jgi:hypothetical protein
MSYSTDLDNTSVYGMENNHQLVNAVPDYKTLGNYYNKPNCPYQTVPGQCAVTPVFVTPTFGGAGYNILQNGLNGSNLPDGNYFTLSNAYPAWPYSPCMKPLV